jgi:hypothetical protein
MKETIGLLTSLRKVEAILQKGMVLINQLSSIPEATPILQ